MTSKENQIAKSMVELIKNIEEHTGQLDSGDLIPQLELEIIVSKIKLLYERAVILKYLHSHLDEIKPDEKKPLHEKIIEKKTSPPLSSSIKATFVKSPTVLISLHEKLMIQKELFGGSPDEYNDALKIFETEPDFQKAKIKTEEVFAGKHSWEKKSETVKAFFAMFEKKS